MDSGFWEIETMNVREEFSQLQSEIKQIKDIIAHLKEELAKELIHKHSKSPEVTNLKQLITYKDELLRMQMPIYDKLLIQIKTRHRERIDELDEAIKMTTQPYVINLLQKERNKINKNYLTYLELKNPLAPSYIVVQQKVAIFDRLKINFAIEDAVSLFCLVAITGLALILAYSYPWVTFTVVFCILCSITQKKKH